MENQTVTPEVVTTKDGAQKGIQNTLGVIKVVEGLFNGLRAGSYPLHVTEQVTAGMQFLGQFHTQLVAQLPPALVEELRKASTPEVVKVGGATFVSSPKSEAANEPVKA